MIAQVISDTLKRIGHSWKSENKFFVPDEEDVEAVLDQAAVILYDKEVGTRLEVGGIIVERRVKGFDVYVYAGPYN